MTETQALLGKITALRQRLDQAQSLANDARSAVAALAEEGHDPPGDLARLDRQLEGGTAHDLQLDRIVRPLVAADGGDEPPGPRQLTARARLVLERGRELLLRLREMAEVFSEGVPPESGAVRIARGDPLGAHYRETIALTDTALRTVLLFPSSTAAQLHLCEGLEATLDIVAWRLRVLQASIEGHRQESAQLRHLATILSDLEAGRRVTFARIASLAELVLGEAWMGAPLRFAQADIGDPVRFIAAHGLSVARVTARVVRHDPDFRTHPLDAVASALVQDAGMLRVPVAIIAHPGPLTDDQRRTIEGHCRIGGDLLAPLRSEAAWLVSAATHHHERLDGTGYPDGLRELQVPPLARVLGVCDVYAALCANRPHRTARQTRTALADTLLLADEGLLDSHYAECLLHLSFYPVGSVVELADGSVAGVVATPGARRDLSSPARPVLQLLLNSDGKPLPLPRHIDLGQAEGPSIVRNLSDSERRDALGAYFPEWL
jgi:HD-GYP domain-containing protein (c-di-GMP phosphodiesterase class II)